MLRKALLLVLLTTAVRMLIGCCSGEWLFRWTKFSTLNLDVSGAAPVAAASDSVRTTAYGFGIVFDFERVSRFVPEDLGMQSAWALSCNYFYINRDTLRTLRITTLNRLDANHPAGSEINDMLFARPNMTTEDTIRLPFTPLPAALRTLNADSGMPNRGLDFVFRSPGLLPGRHLITVRAITASGRTLIDSTAVRLY